MKTDKTKTLLFLLTRSSETPAHRHARATLRKLGAELELLSINKTIPPALIAKRTGVPVSVVLAVFNGDDLALRDLVSIGSALGVRLSGL